MMRTLRFVLLLIPLMALGTARQKPAVEFPDQPRNMWAISGVNPIMFVDTEKGLFRSLDDGKTWLPASRGLPASIGSGAYSPITAIAATDSSRIYALTEVNGVYRTSTGGATWDDASSGLPVPLMRRTEGSLLAIDPVDGRRLFLLLRAPVTSHHIRTLLFQSSDAGTSWGLRKDLREETFMAMAAGNDSLLTLISEDGSQVKVDTRLDADSHAHLNVTDLLSGDTAPRAVQPINDRDIDNIAVIEDDGSMLVKQFDLSRKSFEFRPNGEGGYSIHAVTPVFDSEIGDVFELFDDDARMMAMPFSFRFYDRPYQTIFINSNGSVSFERGERAATASMGAFFSGRPRIAALWEDHDPSDSEGGRIHLSATASRIAITWNDVRLWRTTTPSKFQILLLPNGIIRINYATVEARDGIVGVSNGGVTTGQLVDFASTASRTDLPALPIAQLFDTPDLNIVQVAKRFYQTHDDLYDSLVMFTPGSFAAESMASGAIAYYAAIKNDVKGIGVSIANFSSQFGSTGQLQGVINMNTLSTYPNDPAEAIPDDTFSLLAILGQEWGHRFGSFVRFRDGANVGSALLGRSVSHWNYFMDSDGSVMEGGDWRDDGNGSFTVVDHGRRYSRLDQYLMGLRNASEVPSFFIVGTPQPLIRGTVELLVSSFGRTDNGIQDSTKDFGAEDRYKGFRLAFERNQSVIGSASISNSSRNQDGPAPGTLHTTIDLRQTYQVLPNTPYQITKNSGSAPQSRYFEASTGRFTGDNITFNGTRTDMDLNRIIEYEGERLPPRGSAPTSFRHAFILVVPKGQTATPADMAKMTNVRRRWEAFYREATDNLSTVSTELFSGVSRISNSVANGGIASYGSRSVPVVMNVGYGRLESGTEQAAGVTFLTGRTGGRIVTEAAVPALGTLSRAQVYAEKTATINTGIAIAAPHVATAVTLQLRASTGSVSATATLNIPAGGQVARFANDLFSGFTFPTEFRGTISIEATAPIVVVTLRTLVNEVGEFLITTMPAADMDTRQTSASYLAHFADGGGYGTEIVLMNTSSNTTATGTVEFRSPDGNLLSVNVGGTSTSSTSYSIPAGGVEVFSTAGGSGSLRSGYITVRATNGQNGPVVRGIINLSQSGRTIAMTGMFPSVSSSRARVFVDLTGGHNSGFALLNDRTAAASVRLTLFNSLGTPLAGAVTLSLAPGSQTARFVTQLFPGVSRDFRGMMEIASDSPVHAVTLRSTETSDRFLLAAFPVEALDVPRNERVLYFPHLVEGSGFTSEVFLANLGTAASTPRLSFISQSGTPQRFFFRPSL